MSTTPIVLVNNPISDGTMGSASQVLGIFSDLRNQGQIAINDLVVLRENTLLQFNNILSEMNGKSVRINRLPEIGIALKFVTTDLQDINQSITTATVRADANSFCLRERQTPGQAIIASVTFSSSEGTIQALQVPQTGSSGNIGALYRVATADGSSPTGTFDIQLVSPVSLSLVIFDMMDTPSSASVNVSISQNGINYTPAISVTRNGYRFGAWFQPQEIQYIQITVIPALPDILGGNVFTFGLTDLHAFIIQYHLLSDVYTNQLEIVPQTPQVQFVTDTVPGLTYFLTLAGQPPIEVFPGTIVSLPGTSSTVEQRQTLIAPTGSLWVSNTAYLVNDTVIDSNGNLQTVFSIDGLGISGTNPPVWSITGTTTIDNPGPNEIIWIERAWAQLDYTLPGDIYLSTLEILDHATQDIVRTAPGLPYNTSIGLTNQYFSIIDNNIYLLPYNQAVDQNRTFDIAYASGPDKVTTSLQVQLQTNDLNITPIYSGASLVAIQGTPTIVLPVSTQLFQINGTGSFLAIGYINGVPL